MERAAGPVAALRGRWTLASAARRTGGRQSRGGDAGGRSRVQPVRNTRYGLAAASTLFRVCSGKYEMEL